MALRQISARHRIGTFGSVCLLVAGTPIYIAAAELRARKPKAKTPRSAVVESQTAASVA